MRLENKYLVPRSQLNELRAAVLPHVNYDAFCESRPSRDYTVRSIYFDTAPMDDYEAKDAGILSRKKIRIRGYNTREENSKVFLEIKRKLGPRIGKSRAPVLYSDLQQIVRDGNLEAYFQSRNLDHKTFEDARSFLYHVHRGVLNPKVLVMYEREAFHGKFDKSIRISFDKNLRSVVYPGLDDIFVNEPVCHILTDYFTFELKFFHSIPTWVKSVMKRFGFIQRALSKYTMCFDSHNVSRKLSKSARIPSSFHSF